MSIKICDSYKLDRFSRNKFEMAIHRKNLKDNGIKILSAISIWGRGKNVKSVSIFAPSPNGNIL